MWQIKQESFHRKTPSWTSWYRAMNQEHQLGYIKMKTSYQKIPLREWRGKHKNVKENLPYIYALNTHQTARMKELMWPHIREPLPAHTLQMIQTGTNTTRAVSTEADQMTPLLVTPLNTPNRNVYISAPKKQARIFRAAFAKTRNNPDTHKQ